MLPDDQLALSRESDGRVLGNVPKDIMTSKKNGRKLVLHFDIRNTLLVADSVTNVNSEQALNSFLTSVTWGKEVDGQWQWCSDSPSLTQPQPDVMTYYKYLERKLVRTPSDRAVLRRQTGDFTQEPIGQRFVSYFKEHLDCLRWTHGPANETLTMKGTNGTRFHYILPAFFKLLLHLEKENRDYCIVLRTYGLDSPNVLACIQLAIQGKHPCFPQTLPLSLNPIPGKIKRTNAGDIQFEFYKAEKAEVYSNEIDTYNMLSQLTGVVGFVDDFVHWQDNDYHHKAGKPLWVDPTDSSVHHIFFDDNIRMNEIDSIVDMRIIDRTTNSCRSVDLDEMARLEDVCLVQADLLECLKNHNHFIDKVRKCETNYDDFVTNFNVNQPKI